MLALAPHSLHFTLACARALTAPTRPAACRPPPPPPRLLHGLRCLCSTTHGRRASTPPARSRPEPAAAAMNEGWNPTAMPFRPRAGFIPGNGDAYSTSNAPRREQHFYPGFEHQPPAPPLFSQYPPPPPPPPFPPNNINAAWEFAPPPFFNQNYAGPPPFHGHAAQSQAPQEHWMQQRHVQHQQEHPQQSRLPQEQQHFQHMQQQQNHPWVPSGYPPGYMAGPPGPPGIPSAAQNAHFNGPPPFGMPPNGMPPNGFPPMHGAPPAFGMPRQQANPGRGYPPMGVHGQVNYPYGPSSEEIQTSTPPPRKFKSGATVNGPASRKENANGSAGAAGEKKGRYGDSKIMLPAPQPTAEYLAQAAEEPSAAETPRTLLVILDLNGTVLFRPNKNAKTMIERPFLKPFLRYLFQNFKVMVWSSAKPDNVKSLVSQALDNNLRSQLVAQWARDSFGLSPTNYAQNVQVYKNLKLIWSRSLIQTHHPEYEAGQRFGQHNTVLIDDSALKANAQPHNLLEIPEFSATPEQMEGDALREVAGYLEVLRLQQDVSKFIRQTPFVAGRWSYEWPDEVAGGGELTAKVTGKKNSKKNKKRQANAAVLDADNHIESSSESKNANDALETDAGASAAPLEQAVDSLRGVSITGPLQKDW